MSTSTVFPVVEGREALGNAALKAVYDTEFLAYLYTSTVFSGIANTDWESRVSDGGEKVIIPILPAVNTFEYEKGGKIPDQHITIPKVELLLDKSRGYSLPLDHVDLKQSHLMLKGKLAPHAARTVSEAIDSECLSTIYADAAAYNRGDAAGMRSGAWNLGVTGTPLEVTELNCYRVLTVIASVLAEADVPNDNERFVVFDETFANMLRNSQVADKSWSGQSDTSRNGKIGRLAGLNLYVSNQLARGTDGGDSVVNCIFGHKQAVTWATQLQESRIVQPHDTFADVLQGLTVYGRKVVQPQAFGHLYVTYA